MAVVLSVQGQYDGRQIDKAIRDLEQLKKYGASAALGIGNAFTQQGAAIKSFGDRVLATGSKISAAGTSLTRNLSIPLAAIGYASIKTAANFQVAMAQTQVATQASGAEMKKLSALAIKLGQDTVFSATDAGNAMLNLAKGGLTKADIEGGALKSTLDLAAASGIDLAEAASTVTASMNTFGIKAGDVGVAVDALAGAAAASNAEMPDLMMALRQAGQSASMSGLSIQETTAALAAFADKGVIGSDAGTSFKVMLQRLVPQSKQAAILMKSLGLSFFDAAGNTKSLAEIAQELQTGLSGLTEQQRKATLSTLFGTDAIRAANIMYELGGKGMQSYVDLTERTGTAGEFAAARMSGLYGVIEQLRGSIDTALIQNGQALEPTFTAITNAIKDLVNAYSSMSPKMQDTIAKMMMLGVVMGPVIKTIGIFTSGFGLATRAAGTFVEKLGTSVGPSLLNLLAGMNSAQAAQSAFTGRMGTLGGMIARVVPGLSLFTGGLTAILGPALAVAAIIAAIVAVIVLAYKQSKTFRDSVTKLFTDVKRALSEAFKTISDAIGETGITMEGVLNVFKAVGDFLGKYIVPLIGFVLVSAIKQAANGIAFFIRVAHEMFNILRNTFDIGMALVRGLWEGISSGGQWLIDHIRDWASGILDNIRGFFGIHSPSKHTEEYGKQIAAGLAVGIDGGKGKVVESSKKVSYEALKAMGLAFDDGSAGAAGKAKAAAEKIAKQFERTVSKVQKTAAKLKDAMKSGLEDILRETNKLMDDLSSQMFDALDAAANAAQSLVDSAKDGVDEMRNSYDDALGVLSNLKDQAASYAGQIRDSLRGAFSLKDALTADNGQSFLQNLRDQVKKFQAFSGQLNQLRSMGLNESSMQEIIQAGVDQGTQIAAAILSGGSGAVSEINSLEAIVTKEASAFGDLLAQDKFGAELKKAQAGLDLASANLAKANNALAAATSARDVLVAEIEKIRTETNTILGKSNDALKTAVDQLAKAMGDPTKKTGMVGVINAVLNEIQARMATLSAMASLSGSTQQQLNDLNGVGSGGGSYMPTNQFGSSTPWAQAAAGNTMVVQSGAVQITAPNADAQQVAEIVDKKLSRMARESFYLL